MPAPENTAKSAVAGRPSRDTCGELLLSRVPSSCDSSFGYEQANLFFQDDNLHTPLNDLDDCGIEVRVVTRSCGRVSIFCEALTLPNGWTRMEQIVTQSGSEIKKLQPKNVFNLPPDTNQLSSLSGPLISFRQDWELRFQPPKCRCFLFRNESWSRWGAQTKKSLFGWE